MEPAVLTPAPAAWPSGTFELDRGVGLAVCVAHRGIHCWHAGACTPVGGRQASPIGPFRPCTLHEGRHLYVRGHCINPGRRYAYRYGRCPDDGCTVEICNRLDVMSGRTDRLDAETDRPHVHAPPIRVELDEERLAAAIVAASRAARQATAATLPARPVATRQPPAEGAPPPALPEQSGAPIPTVAVWSPGPDDGLGT